VQSADDADLQEPLSRISRAGKHLLSLISDVHDLSKIEAGHIQLVPERIELPNFVDDVVLTVDDLAAREGNDLVIEHWSALPTLWTDPLRLRQVLITLLSNSCKFTAQGRICLTAAPSSPTGS